MSGTARRATLLAALVVWVLASPLAGTAAGGAPDTTVERPAVTVGPVDAVDPPSYTLQSFDRSTVEIVVYGNGSARWTFRYARRLGNETEVERFRAFADRFVENETELYRDFRTDARAIVRNAAGTTGRNMTAEAFSRSAFVERSLGDNLGVVTMSFRWTAFARLAGPRVVVGDVFEGGLYLGPDQTLVVRPGPSLVFEAVAPGGIQSNTSSLRASDSVTWRGERQFTDNRPHVEFVPAGTATATPGTAGPTVTATSTPAGTAGAGTAAPGGTADEESTRGPETGGTPWLPVVAVGLPVGTLLAVGVWYLRRARSEASTPTASGAEGTGDDDAPDRPTGPGPDTEAADAAGTPGREPSVSDEELLPDDERVRRLLEANGGRMRQSDIVDETGWSKSKVSMVLSEMEEAGEVSKLRIGRENVVSLGDEPLPEARDDHDDGDGG